MAWRPPVPRVQLDAHQPAAARAALDTDQPADQPADHVAAALGVSRATLDRNLAEQSAKQLDQPPGPT